ncbi:MAG TPA: prolyl oligopeptidase family serine peptidase [Planctomycetota bacterium]|nr:prolyl oligopeptidase family serine peptidase [Planctomycetota bacterium]
MIRSSLLLSLFAIAACAFCGTPQKPGPKRLPPEGVPIPDAEKAELSAGAKQLGEMIEKLKVDLKGKPELLDLLPDVQIYHNALRYALTYDEFFDPKDAGSGKMLVKTGLERARQLAEGKPSWTTATGLVPRGYVSKIDGSVQPYGLVVPETFKPDAGKKHRLDFWFHGRDDKLSELRFVASRHKDAGEFTPADTIVAHLYGRYCNANKFAGEMDLFETLEHVRKHYPIDDARILVRGFSMGGAACWHFGVHHPGLWAGVAPGAGFTETPEYTKAFQSEPKPTWFEQKLWRWYDSVDYAVNLFNVPTIAYSGELDKQKQASDAMAKAMKEEGIELKHVIGPNTPHKYHPDSKKEINAFLDEAAAKGNDPVPQKIRFTTWTLRYNRMKWIIVDGLEKHWDRARVDAEIKADAIDVKTQNVSALTLEFPAGRAPAAAKILIDGSELAAPPAAADKSFTMRLAKSGGKWAAAAADDGSLRKRHRLQGPIDDAFLDSFIMVKPTGKPLNAKVGEWAAKELDRAIKEWRSQYRGEARVMNDDAITEAEIAGSNLVLWGDPSSNKILAKIADKLPIKWDDKSVRAGELSFSSEHHAPVMIYPNPLNPKRYVVINSGFTFREQAYTSNARQIPNLPDYAIVDLNTPPNNKWPGAIVDANFFGEKWELLPPVK